MRSHVSQGICKNFLFVDASSAETATTSNDTFRSSNAACFWQSFNFAAVSLAVGYIATRPIYLIASRRSDGEAQKSWSHIPTAGIPNNLTSAALNSVRNVNLISGRNHGSLRFVQFRRFQTRFVSGTAPPGVYFAQPKDQVSASALTATPRAVDAAAAGVVSLQAHGVTCHVGQWSLHWCKHKLIKPR